MKRERLIKGITYGMFAFIVLFTLYSFVGRILPVYMFVNEPINGYIFIVFVFAGSILTGADFFAGRYMFKGKYCCMLYAFIGVMAASSIVNIKYGYVDNAKTIIWTGIQVAIFYSAYTRLPKEKMLKFVHIIFCMISCIWTAAVVYSLKQFVTAESYGVEIWEGEWRLQGFRENRLFGIFNDPNYAAVTSVWVIFMLLYIAFQNRKRWIRIICFLVGVCHGTYIILSGSRTSAVCFFAGSFVCIFLLLKNKFMHSKKLVSTAIRIGSSLMVVCLLGAAGIGIKKGMSHIPEIYLRYQVEKISSSNSSADVKEKEVIVKKSRSVSSVGADRLLNRKDVKAENISNNRMDIWRNYIAATQGKYMLGASPRNLLKNMEKEHPDIYAKNRDYETHNGFISLFAGTGIIGSITIIIFMVLIGKRVIEYCFSKEKIEWQFVIPFSIITTILVYTCFFTELFFVNNLTTTLFWMLLGTMMYWVEEK